MVIKSKVVDLSYFLHLEATCDSEAGYFDPAMPAVINHDHNDDNDDAESYSCEYDTTSDLHMVIELNYISDDHANVGGDDEEDGEVVDQEFAYHLYMLIRLPVRNKVRDNLPRKSESSSSLVLKAKF
ncbi:hypothetical protein V6N12_011611 [Hibiscus sabdariffa]|uniref:Uncharacterized protein n=1 Tax=Hibiscus sabdariffa TaxID=183260 RepID=A0ABR2AZ23_9ROSI